MFPDREDNPERAEPQGYGKEKEVKTSLTEKVRLDNAGIADEPFFGVRFGHILCKP
jgi:hypothetical protein